MDRLAQAELAVDTMARNEKLLRAEIERLRSDLEKRADYFILAQRVESQRHELRRLSDAIAAQQNEIAALKHDIERHVEIAASLAQQAGVREPTEAMLKAGAEAIGGYDTPFDRGRAREVWNAMRALEQERVK